MEKSALWWVGKSCGQHGPYTFYKSFNYKKDCRWKSLSMGDFFFVRCSENEPLCIAELQLLWETKNSEGMKLTSSRLYFLPECTPEGRMEWHGEDEVLAVRDKVVLKAEDLVDWIVTDVDWAHGCSTIWQGESSASGCSSEQVGAEEDRDKSWVTIVSYNRYCRHKAMLKRLESTGRNWWACPEVAAMGLIIVPHKGTKMLFCRDEFEHPSLAENEQLCDHLAPKLKGRPRKKKVLAAEEQEKDKPKVVHMTRATVKKEIELQPLRRTRRKATKLNKKKGESTEEAEFLEKLYKFMHKRSTPIERLPSVGFKQINLFEFFKMTQHYGGHESITSQRLWKRIYVELGGNPGCTSAATCTRRHYERYIQPYAMHVNKISKRNNKAKPRLKAPRKAKQDNQPETKSVPVTEIRPRKRVKKVREHLEELKKLRAVQQQTTTNGLHLLPLKDVSTVQPSSLPGHVVDTKVERDANFNIEPKSLLDSMGTASVTLSRLSAKQLLRPDDLRHKLNSKHQSRAKTMTIKHFIDQEVTKDLSSTSQVASSAETTSTSSSSPSVMSRPSVIQHTQQKTVEAERRSPHRPAVQPSDLILRNLAHQAKTPVEQSSKGSASAGAEHLNHLRPPFVFPGLPYLRPFMPYPPMFIRPRMPLMNLPQGKGRASPHYPPGTAKDLNIPARAHQVPVIQPSSIIPGWPVQEEPCDLSLPKKRKPPDSDVPKVKKMKLDPPVNQSGGMNGFIKTNQMITPNLARHRMVAKQMSLAQRIPSASVKDNVPRREEPHRVEPHRSPLKSVKMTPQPRGSITQGVINIPPPLTDTRERKPKRDKPSGTTETKPPTVELKGLPPFMHPGMTGFMAATRGMAPFPFMPGLFRPGFPPMVQTPAGFLPQTPFLPPHSPLLGATVPTSLARGQETMLPRGVIVPGPLALAAASMYRTPVPPVATDKQPDN